MPNEIGPTQPKPEAESLQSKIRVAVALLKLTACCYLAWVLWFVLAPLRAPDDLLHWLSRVWHRDLATAGPWQLWTYLAVDLLGWALAAASCAWCWRAVSTLGQPHSASASSNWRQLTVGAWLAVGAEGYSLLTRPLKSVVMTWHEAAPPLIAWSLSPQDFIVAMLCLALLALAYVTAWNAQLAAENRGFL